MWNWSRKKTAFPGKHFHCRPFSDILMVNTVNWISIGASTSRNFWTAFSFIQRKRLNAIDFVIELKRMRETRAMHIETGMQCILYVNYPIFLHDINSIFDISSVCIFCFCCFKKYTRTITLAKIEQSGDDKKLAKCSEERKKDGNWKLGRKFYFVIVAEAMDTARRIRK